MEYFPESVPGMCSSLPYRMCSLQRTHTIRKLRICAGHVLLAGDQQLPYRMCSLQRTHSIRKLLINVQLAGDQQLLYRMCSLHGVLLRICAWILWCGLTHCFIQGMMKCFHLENTFYKEATNQALLYTGNDEVFPPREHIL